MENKEHDLLQINSAFPNEFEFYHLGSVSLQNSTESLPSKIEIENLNAIGFQFQGDIQALLILLFDKSLDHSMYSEMGNILASKIATHLSQDQSIEIEISPPVSLTEAQYRRMTQSGLQKIQKTYQHFSKGLMIPMEALILITSAEEFGNA